MGYLRYFGFVFYYFALLLLRNKTLGGTLEAMARRRGEAPCCAFGDETLSYAALNRAANRRANLLRAEGVAKGEAVCLLMENRPEYVASIVALAKLGAATALINHGLRGQALVHSIDISGAERVVVGRECLEALLEVLPQLERVRAGQVYVDTRGPAAGALPEGLRDLDALLADSAESDPPRPALNSRDPVLYIYTSGTTGLPKAARITHYRWYAAGLAMGYYALGLGRDDVVYCPLPLYHSNGSLIALGSALVNGATLALAPRFSASAFWDEARRLGATCFIYIGEIMRYLVNQQPSPAEREHGVTRVLGNGLRPDIWEEARERFGLRHIREFYASTEGNAVTINMDDTPSSVGTPVLKLSDNTELVRFDVDAEDYVRDGQGRLVRCAPGEVGELLGRITFTLPFHGYTTARDTERKVLRDVFKRGDAYFRTGDLMKRDAQGHYFFVDRIGDTFRWKGENVSTQEVQEILAAHPAIHLVNVYGVRLPHAEGRVGMAAVQMAEGHPFDGGEVYRIARERLPGYAVPAFIRLVSEMDMTGTYKLRKIELQKQGYDPAQVPDGLYYLDPAGQTYLPLTPEVHARIERGELNF